jgi:hypothetical protein
VPHHLGVPMEGDEPREVAVGEAPQGQTFRCEPGLRRGHRGIVVTRRCVVWALPRLCPSRRCRRAHCMGLAVRASVKAGRSWQFARLHAPSAVPFRQSPKAPAEGPADPASRWPLSWPRCWPLCWPRSRAIRHVNIAAAANAWARKGPCVGPWATGERPLLSPHFVAPKGSLPRCRRVQSVPRRVSRSWPRS